MRELTRFEHGLISLRFFKNMPIDEERLKCIYRHLVRHWDTDVVKEYNLSAQLVGADPLNGETIWYPLHDHGYLVLNRTDLREQSW